MSAQPVTYTRPQETHRIVQEELAPHFSKLARCRSSEELLAHPTYQAIARRLETVLAKPEIGTFSREPAAARPHYRFLAWNLERGIQLDEQLRVLRDHPYLSTCDVLLLTETDVGMARSSNREVAQEIASELGMHYAFAPCYLNLSKGAGLESEVDGENHLGLHGNAILSRYPLRAVRPVHLKNGKDKMTGREKRIGRQTALVAEVGFPDYPVTVVSVHLDAQSTQRHRRDQMRDVLDALPPRGPVVIGGDWNTTTYNSSRAFYAIMGFWLRVFMGVDHVIRQHYLHPYHRFEKELFDLLESQGFDYRRCNRLGERTSSYDADCLKTHRNLREWVPAWCFAFIRWSLRNHGGKCPFKIDWFATREVNAGNPVIVYEFREGRAEPLSDHDPIGVDALAP